LALRSLGRNVAAASLHCKSDLWARRSGGCRFLRAGRGFGWWESVRLSAFFWRRWNWGGLSFFSPGGWLVRLYWQSSWLACRDGRWSWQTAMADSSADSWSRGGFSFFPRGSWIGSKTLADWRDCSGRRPGRSAETLAVDRRRLQWQTL
jgi:hypothetical protein